MSIRLWLPVAAIAALGLREPPSTVALHLDHVPIVVRNFEAALSEFAAIGFTIKQGRPHDNGIINASIKFRDGSYLEVITAHHATDTLANEYERLLAEQEGAAYMFLRDTAEQTFTSRVLRAGGHRQEAGPFAFTELPASWHGPHLQLIEYLSPARDPTEVYRHLSGALRLVAVWVAPDRADPGLGSEFGARPIGAKAFSFDDRRGDAVPTAPATVRKEAGMYDPRWDDPRELDEDPRDLEIQWIGLARFDRTKTRGPSSTTCVSAMLTRAIVIRETCSCTASTCRAATSANSSSTATRVTS